MSVDTYRRLAGVLDTLPNGFPSTESGVELKILEKIFTPQEAALFCDLRLAYETAEQITQRTGRPLEGLEERLRTMADKGQIYEVRMGASSLFKMVPFIVGLWEGQRDRIDKDLVAMFEDYFPALEEQLLSIQPQIMQTLAIEETIPFAQEALPYERVSTILEFGQSFSVNTCVCKKERGMLGNPCEKPREVCLFVVPIPGYFEQFPAARAISRDEAYALLNETEEAGLVHMTSNVQAGQYFICNCCGCCCGILRAIREDGLPARLVINSHYYAETDPERCNGCGICADERCQIDAIVEEEGIYRVVQERCIGCGLCASACLEQAVRLVRKDDADLMPPPSTEEDWFEQRGRARGVDFSAYK
jgi:Fe-S-cluster-containing hydrogenase component 2